MISFLDLTDKTTIMTRGTLSVCIGLLLQVIVVSSHGNHGSCGLDQYLHDHRQQFHDIALNETRHNDQVLRQRRSFFRTRASDDNTAFKDNRYKRPSQSQNNKEIPDCLIETFSGFGSPYSECYFEEVIHMYTTSSGWPNADLKLRVIHLKSSSNNQFVDTDEINRMVDTINNDIYTGTGIQYTATIDTVVDDSLWNKYQTAVSSSNLDSYYSNLASDFSISSDPTQRTDAATIIPVNADVNSFIGICFPEPRVLGIPVSGGINPAYGAVCLVDYRWIKDVRFDFDAGTDSYGRTAPHELGHSLGLWHPHQDVPIYSVDSASCILPDSSRSCYAAPDDYSTGDYILDTEPLPLMTVIPYGDGNNYYDTSTCTVGPLFPENCFTGEDFVTPNTVARNIMAYTAEECQTGSNVFTNDQISRMRCFIDRYIDDGTGKRVTARNTDSPILVVPSYDSDTDTSVLVEWYPPLNLLNGEDETRSNTLPTPSDLQFELERSPPFPGSTVKTFDSSTYSYEDSDVSLPYEQYFYRVVAVRTGGNRGVEGPYFETVQSSSHQSLPSLLIITMFVCVFMLLSM